MEYKKTQFKNIDDFGREKTQLVAPTINSVPNSKNFNLKPTQKPMSATPLVSTVYNSTNHTDNNLGSQLIVHGPVNQGCCAGCCWNFFCCVPDTIVDKVRNQTNPGGL